MTHFPHDEEKLLAFLRQHRPVPPLIAPNFEEELIEMVGRYPRQRKPHRLFWAIPSAIAASFLLTWGGYRWLHPTPQIAINPDELEAFLVDNWNGTTGQATLASQSERIDTDWIFLADPEMETRRDGDTGTR